MGRLRHTGLGGRSRVFPLPSLLWNNRAVEIGPAGRCLLSVCNVHDVNCCETIYEVCPLHPMYAPFSPLPRPILLSPLQPTGLMWWRVFPPSVPPLPALFFCRGKNRINSRAQKFAENSPTTKGRGKMVKFMFLGDPESGKTAIVTR